MGALYNLARMTSPTTGNGATLVLGSPVAGFLAFAQAGVSDGETVSYGIRDGNASEIGEGVYTSAGTTLTRNVTKSTNADSRLSLSGSAQVYVTPRAEDLNGKVAKAGDTMTGTLAINSPATLNMNGGSRGANSVVNVRYDGSVRSGLEISNAGSGAGGAAGDILTVYNNANQGWTWTWDSGQTQINIGGQFVFTDNLKTAGTLLVTGAGASSIGGTLAVAGYLTAPTVIATAPGNNWAVHADGAGVAGQSLGVAINAGYVNTDYALLINNGANSTTFFTVRGDNAVIAGNGAYKPGGGPWADSSDARIKNILGDYGHGLAEVTQLAPVWYTFKGNDANLSLDKLFPARKSAAAPMPNSPHYAPAVDGTRFIGLIAQDVESVMPEMVSLHEGYIDGVAVSDMRELDTTPLLFALVNAVKELAARVEALEGTASPR